MPNGHRPKTPAAWALACAVVLAGGCGAPPPEVDTLEQVLTALQQRGNRPVFTWKGEGRWTLGRKGFGGSDWGLQERHSPSHRLERYCRHKLQAGEPVGLLGLLEADDPELVLTGLYVYWRGVNAADRMPPEQRATVADLVRAHCLGHADPRVRWTAYRGLASRRVLMLPDFDRALDDPEPAVRIEAIFWLEQLVQDHFTYDTQGRLVKGDPGAIEEALARRDGLVRIALRHINDEHFYVRHGCYRTIVGCLRRWVAAGRGRAIKDYKLPVKVDWVQADLPARLAAQQALTDWWETHSGEALRWALPDPTGGSR